jgi:competence ComEA-like helix-hairpin-helix protein
MVHETADSVKQICTQSHAFIVAMGFCALSAIIFGVITFAKGGHNDRIEPLGRINPNEASAVSLARLPGIGIGRANAIVEYRREYAINGGQGAVFTDCNDLDKVKGIGPATVKKIQQWVEFK